MKSLIHHSTSVKAIKGQDHMFLRLKLWRFSKKKKNAFIQMCTQNTWRNADFFFFLFGKEKVVSEHIHNKQTKVNNLLPAPREFFLEKIFMVSSNLFLLVWYVYQTFFFFFFVLLALFLTNYSVVTPIPFFFLLHLTLCEGKSQRKEKRETTKTERKCTPVLK